MQRTIGDVTGTLPGKAKLLHFIGNICQQAAEGGGHLLTAAGEAHHVQETLTYIG